MNPYYYLFYKFTRFLNRKGDNEWGPIGAVTLFVGWNIVIVYVKLFNVNEHNLNGIFKTILIIISILLFITNAILFTNERRVGEIINSYKGESETCRIVGNVVVILYVVSSLGLVLFL